jgi:methylated-DNA-[protein]-cysteine S-methyltransferase
MPTTRTATAFGVCTLEWTGSGISRIRLPDYGAHLAVTPAVGVDDDVPAPIMQTIAELRSYFSGLRVGFSTVTLDLSACSAHDIAIYEALRRVRFGDTTTYGALAAAVKHRCTARDIGVAMARNPCPVVIPCHRVLAAGGRIGGFSAPGGTRTKERLLTLEGARLELTQPSLPGLL